MSVYKFNHLAALAVLTLVIFMLVGCDSESNSSTISPVDSMASSSSDKEIFPVKIKGHVLDSTPSKIKAEDLSDLKQTTYTVDNPWDKKRHTYRGVLLKDFVAAYGKAGTNFLRFRAIDDFKADFSKSEWEKWDVLLATHEDGELMGVAEGGPLKIVMPYHTNKEIDPMVYNDKWIWTISKVEFVEK